ncbi:MAG: efflux RND transporter periplasmic adaptor subunit [Saprospiraceae bacterium]
MKKVLNIIIYLAVFGAIGGAIYWKLGQNKQQIEERAKTAQMRNDIIPVRTAAVSRQKLSADFSVSGTFRPYQQLAVISEVQGKITQLNYKNGDFVQAGATLLSVDNEALQIQMDIAKVNLAKSEKDLGRLKNLLGDGGITQQQIDDVQNAVENLKGQIRSLDKQMRTTLVKAPISGTVTGRLVEKGAFVAPAMKILDIVNVNRLKMAVYLTDEEVFEVKKGQQVTLVPDLYAGARLSGTVTFIDVQADNSKRFLVEIELPNPSSAPLKAGMAGRAYFSTGKQTDVLALPRECVVGSVRDASVFVAVGGKAELRPIQLGRIFGAYAEVLGGLKEGEQVVISGQINLQDGTKITVQDNSTAGK